MIALLREQRRLGHDVAAIVPSLDGTIAAQLARESIPCYAAPVDVLAVSGFTAKLRAIVALFRLLRRLRPDVVHSHIIGAVVAARIASWLADVPVHFGGNVHPISLESDLLRPLELGTAFCDTKTIASCSYTRELYARHGVPEEQLETIFYAVDQSAHDPALTDGMRVWRELGIDANAPVIGKAAYFYAPANALGSVPLRLQGRGVKGHDVLIRAVPRVLESFPDAKFVLVGRGWGAAGVRYEQKLKMLVRELGVESAVLFPGERQDVPDTLASFDVSVHCSLTDNLGGTVESLLMEKPMVVSDIRGFADPVQHEETGLVVPVDDPPSLADAIVRLLRDRPLAQRLGQNGRRRMLERFTLAHSVAAIEALLARAPGRAKDHYRLATTLRRLIAAPFRFLPMAREAQRVHREVRAARPRIAQVAGAHQGCQWFVDLCRDLDEHGYDVVAVIDETPGDLAERLTAAGIRHHRIAMTFAMHRDRSRLPVYALRVPLAALRLARILRRERVDLVHSHIFTSIIVARLASALARKRHVAMIPGPRHLEAPFTRVIDRATLWLDDMTIAGCEYTRGIYESLSTRRERLACIYYGVDASRFEPARADANAARRDLHVPPDVPLVTLVAHFYAPTRGAQTPPHTLGVGLKGHDDFLAAARIVARRRPDARFVLAGAGVLDTGEAYRQSLIEQCRADELLRDRVLFTGNYDDVPSLLAASDVAVQCSLTENLGGTIESLLMERPTVATRAGGMPESVRDGETGILVSPANPGELAAAILRLLENREEAAALGKAGRELMLDRFTLARTISDLASAYARVL